MNGVISIVFFVFVAGVILLRELRSQQGRGPDHLESLARDIRFGLPWRVPSLGAERC
jgi:hypothetical protein